MLRKDQVDTATTRSHQLFKAGLFVAMVCDRELCDRFSFVSV